MISLNAVSILNNDGSLPSKALVHLVNHFKDDFKWFVLFYIINIIIISSRHKYKKLF